MLLGVGPPRWEQLGLEALKRRVISFCPKGQIFWPRQGAAAEKKSSHTGGVGGGTILCVSASADESLGAENGGGR